MWYYQIFKITDPLGLEDDYVIKEYYPKEKEDIGTEFDGGWTEDAITPHGTTRDELIRDLAMMLEDALTHGIRDSKTGELIEE